MKRAGQRAALLAVLGALGLGAAEPESPREHWAFCPLPRVVPVPESTDAAWARNPIDRFVFAALAREGLAPEPPAERWRLLRRASLDLTGLPPTWDDVRAFEADRGEDAFERRIDALLADPGFGEHMAVAWLDLARYADSYGYQSDQLMPSWPYRDWVVRAFQENRGFDRFVIDQLAGDLQPGATREQVLATAFQRLHRQTNEGGSIREEYRVEYAADRVRTFGTAFLGLTLECARCHDHKYDPISQRDYYALMGFFNSIDENGLYHDSARVPTPSLLLPTPQEEERLAALEREVERARKALRACGPSGAAPAPDETLARGLVGHYPLDAFGAGRSLANLAGAEKPGRSGPGNRIVAGKRGSALQLSGDDVASFPGVCGALRPHEPFTIAFWMRVPEADKSCVVLHRTSGTDVGFFGTELTLQRGRLRLAMLRHWPGNAIAIETRDALPIGRWLHVAISSEGTYAASGLRILVDGLAATRVLRDRLEKKPAHGGSGFDVGQRFRDFGFARGAIDELRAYTRVLSTLEVRRLAGVAPDETPERTAEHARAHDAARAKLAATLRDKLRALYDARTKVREISVMRDTAQPAPTHVLARGAYDAPRSAGTRVARATPPVLPGRVRSTDDRKVSRAELAAWLTGAEHPLLARVTVNRVWQRFFGRGLVATPDDFGTRGAMPSHPRLLDWLARDFVDSGWDFKRLCKQIVSSACYRQSSAASASKRAADPDNVQLARGPSRRLTAEQLRDGALALAGLLDRTRGGPPVSPYQPQGLWRESNVMTPAYRQSVGRGLYRRSLYSIWKRTSPLPNMTSFDASSREFCAVQRRDTNTPLQALVLLNDVQFVEAARAFAARVLLEAKGGDEARVQSAFAQATSRVPDEAELRVLLELLEGARAKFVRDPKAAERLLAHGEFARPKEIAAPELAAWSVVTQAILNLDASTWKR